MSDSSCAVGNSIARHFNLFWLAAFCLLAAGSLSAAGNAGDLKLLISVEQTTVNAPLPVRVTLNLHNGGKEPLWLYTPVRDMAVVSGAVNPFTTEDLGEGTTTGGSSLEVHLVPASGANPEVPAAGHVLEVAGFPHPKLMVVAPGEDYEEKAVVQLRPAAASSDASQPIWGAYKFSVTYRARFSNGPNLSAILGTRIWEGEVKSNEIALQLGAPAAESRAAVTGTVVNAHMQPLIGILVTLSDQQEQPLEQQKTDEDGKFSFAPLPFGFYWVTARRIGASEDATVLRHVTPDASNPSQDLQIVLLPVEAYHPDKVLHKPALFRVLDSQHKPVAGVSLEATWSSGVVSDEVKGVTNADGTAMLQLIPGRNFVTLRRKGCPKQDERVDVAPGTGIDGFKMDFDCSKK